MNKLEENPRLKDEFIQQNFGLVHSLANRFRGRGIEYEELFSAGCMGLLKAQRFRRKQRFAVLDLCGSCYFRGNEAAVP